MSKYIIKNCPCLDNGDVCQRCKNWGVESCQDCTDCVMKQIYDLCNKYKHVDIIALHVTKLLQVEEDK